MYHSFIQVFNLARQTKKLKRLKIPFILKSRKKDICFFPSSASKEKKNQISRGTETKKKTSKFYVLSALHVVSGVYEGPQTLVSSSQRAGQRVTRRRRVEKMTRIFQVVTVMRMLHKQNDTTGNKIIDKCKFKFCILYCLFCFHIYVRFPFT